jgi:Family of unknown function (DUF6152)
LKHRLFAASVFAFLFSSSLLAHHSTSMFAMGSPVTVTAVVKEFRWTNPHAFILVELKGANGQAEEWLVEWHSTAILVRRGYSKDTLKPGEVLTLTGGKMKDGSKMMRMLRATTADGKKIWGDDSGNNEPER